jgi:hypothetical protein
VVDLFEISGNEFTVTLVTLLVAEQVKLRSEIVTVYDPLAFAVYDGEVAPGIFVPFSFH